jgi:hypothetical protein
MSVHSMTGHRAHQLLAESTDDSQQATIHRDKAIALAEFVARREGPFRIQARRLLAEIGATLLSCGHRA